MAGPVSGAWARTNQVQTLGATVWGTGINPVHQFYGSPDARIAPLALRQGEVTPAFQGAPDQLLPTELWGYQREDSMYTGMDYDDRPSWVQSTPQFRNDAGNQPPLGSPGFVVTAFRSMRGGAYRRFRSRSPIQGQAQYVVPSETVSEGWTNKAHGRIADARPSDDSQLIVQTSMIQRYQTRNNRAAVARNTDVPRAGIESLVTGQKVKNYSGGERHYDMFPRQQDMLIRPFWYRQAGTGRVGDMLPNTMYTVQGMERIPPAEPAMGTPETEINSQYGYTSEDHFYA